MPVRTAVRCLSNPIRGILTPRPSNSNRGYAAIAEARSLLEQELETIRSGGTWKAERIITSKQGAHINVDGSRGDILNFCANNYLGLSSHPQVVEAGIESLKKYGAGLSSVRFICGTQDIHKDLEKKLAQFHEREDCILYASCFDANAGLFEVLLGPDDAVLSDELNHASIIDGIRLCRAKRFRYKHMDLNDLEAQLKESQSSRMRLVVTDGVFSMDGDVAPLKGICDLAEQYGALVFIDECHATGFMGPRGRGTDELLGVMDRVHIVNSTLGKALGGAAGGYTVGPKPLIELLRQRSRPYLFSNSLPPPVVGCATRAVELLLASNEIAQSVGAKTMRFRHKMTQAGFTISGSAHPICPVMLGDARLASLMADDMLKLGVYVIGFSYPVVPKGKARIRVQISAAHTDQDIDHAVDAFIQTGRKHGVEYTRGIPADMEQVKSAQKENKQSIGRDLSDQIKAVTKDIHVRAENTELMLSYQKGQITLPQYKLLLFSLYEIYKALEQELDRHASHPGVAPIYFPQELARLESLEKDLEHFYGEEWRRRVIIPAATQRYVQRLHTIGKDNPVLLLAHAYTRYLGDLSGGQVLGKITKKSLELSSGEGVSFFSFPGVSSPNRFKQLYRSRMNSIDLAEQEREAMLEEAVRAFELNIQVFDDLQKMLSITGEAYESQHKVKTPATFLQSLSIMHWSLGICAALATVGMSLYAL
ncbi:hypothetical protein UPYG_G00102560 [Umbra pygmaea]|uniref:heme oxygenase (biliverdin-producing) n=1 Tax=Umbra pygmaea TaxID=75934 RepID=A0ABD0X130_UMBPY